MHRRRALSIALLFNVAGLDPDVILCGWRKVKIQEFISSPTECESACQSNHKRQR